MDGDHAPCDVIDVRLQAADTIVFLDFSPLRCAWRVIRWSRGARRLLEAAAYLSPPEPSASPANDRRARQGHRHPHPSDPARRQAIRCEDSLRRVSSALTAQVDTGGALKPVPGKPRDSRQKSTAGQGHVEAFSIHGAMHKSACRTRVSLRQVGILEGPQPASSSKSARLWDADRSRGYGGCMRCPRLSLQHVGAAQEYRT